MEVRFNPKKIRLPPHPPGKKACDLQELRFFHLFIISGEKPTKPLLGGGERRETKKIFRWLRWVFHHFGLAGFPWEFWGWKVSKISMQIVVESQGMAWCSTLSLWIFGCGSWWFLKCQRFAGTCGRRGWPAFGNGRKWYTATWPMDKRLKTILGLDI